MNLDFLDYREATLLSKRTSYDLAKALVRNKKVLDATLKGWEKTQEDYDYLLEDWKTLLEVHKDVWESHDKMQKHLESLGVDVEGLLDD